MILKARLLTFSAIAAVTATGAMTPAWAETAQGDTVARAAAADSAARAGMDSGFAEIIVTARRREERAQTVPISVQAFSSERLTQASVQSLSDIQALTPGLRFGSEGSASIESISLRGLGQVPIGVNLPAAVTYISDVAIPGQGSNTPTYDLANIQVLKGPQGTLFGRNTLAGALVITPARPTYEFEGYVAGTYGNYDYKMLEGAINLPIVQDVLAVRLAGQIRRRDGYNENYSRTLLGLGSEYKDLDITHQDSWRASVLFEPSDRFSNLLVYNHFQAKEDGGTASALLAYKPGVLGPVEPFYGPQIAEYVRLAQENGIHGGFQRDRDGYFRRKYDLIANTTTFELSDNLLIKNIFGFQRARLDISNSVDGVGPLFSPEIGAPLVLLQGAFELNREFISNEFQIQGSTEDGKLEFVAGGFYNHDTTYGPQGTHYNIFDFTADAVRSLDSQHIKNTNKAVFAQITLDLGDMITPGLKFNAGYRHSWDKVNSCSASSSERYFTFKECEVLAAANLPDGAGTASAKGNAPSYMVGLDYQVSPNVFVYAAHRHGYRGVGINQPVFESPFTTGGPGCTDPLTGGPMVCADLRPYQLTGKETVDDFEVGIKTDFEASGVRGRVNVAVYQANYGNILLTLNSFPLGLPNSAPDKPSQTALGVNAGDIRVRGVELETQLQFTDSFSILYNGSLVNQKVTKLTIPPIGNLTFQKNQVSLPTPKYSGTTTLRWKLPLGVERPVTVSADWYHTSRFSSSAAGDRYLPAYDTVNARVDWADIGGSGLSAGLWVRNLLKEDYFSAATVLVAAFPVDSAVPGMPRMYGLDLRFKW